MNWEAYASHVILKRIPRELNRSILQFKAENPKGSETSCSKFTNKILFVNAVSTKTGGGKNDLVNTLRYLGDELGDGWRIHIFVSPQGYAAVKQLGQRNVDLKSIKMTGYVDRAAWEFRSLYRLVKKERPGVVFHFSNFIFRSMPLPQVVVLRSRTFFSKSFLEQPKRGIQQSIRQKVGKFLSCRTIKLAAKTLCISQTQRKEILDRLPNERIEVNYPGVNNIDRTQSTSFSQSVASKLEAFSKGHPAPGPTILNVSNYYEQKNLLVLLQAVRFLADEQFPVRLLLTAGILTHDGSQTTRMIQEKNLAKELTERGVLLDFGTVKKQDVWALMKWADIFAFPSYLESFGHPLLEAFASKLPVIAADTPVHREICGDSALFHEVDDARDLADKIQLLTEDREPRDTMIERGSVRAAEFTWQEHVHRLVQAIESVAA